MDSPNGWLGPARGGPRRTLAIWGLVVLVSLVLVGTSLKGLTTDSHVVGTTQSAQAEGLYNEVVPTATEKPTDVIVVSSKRSTVGDRGFRTLVDRLEAKVRTSPGVTNVEADLGPGSVQVSSNRHAALDLTESGDRRRHQARGARRPSRRMASGGSRWPSRATTR